MNNEKIGQYILTSVAQDNEGYSLWYALKNDDKESKFLVKISKTDNEAVAAKLKYEYQLLKDINIDDLLKPLEFGTSTSNLHYIVFEKKNGLLLSDILSNNNLSLKNFFDYAIAILEVLIKIHDKDIIYKNFRPKNILVDQNTNQISIINFEIASRISREIQEGFQSPNKLEGSLLFISPEQTGRLNRPVDYRSDFYSLGITYYKMLTGKVPFFSDDPMELIHYHIAKQPTNISDIEKSIPNTVSEIIMKMIEKDPDNRYQSAYGILSDLKKCRDEWKKHGRIVNFPIASDNISRKFNLSDKLFGRDDEINTLMNLFKSANTGELSIATISGESGVGKTSLVLEVNRKCIIDNVYYISGKFDQFKRHVPYSAITLCLNKLAECIAVMPKSKLDIIKNEILNAVGDNGQLIIDISPEWENIIGKQPDVTSVFGEQVQARFINTFLRFMNVICTPDHPVIMFIDDLQWVDPASTYLLKKWLQPENTRHLLFITAYRDNEIEANQRAYTLLNELAKKTTIHKILLKSLNNDDLSTLVSSNFHSSEEHTSELVEVVFRNTAGNPFFVNELLYDFYRKRLIDFAESAGKWIWKKSEISEYNVSKNVLQFMLTRLGELPSDVIELLKFASCLGVKFNLAELSWSANISFEECSNKLLLAIKQGLIQPVNFDYKIVNEESETKNISMKVIYKFAHDNVQQAANSLIIKDDLAKYYYKVAKSILDNQSADYIDDNLITITQYYNYSINNIESKTEMEEISTLNNKSGNKAKEAFAYHEAMIFYDNVIHLMNKYSDVYKYDIYYDSYLNKVECLYRLKLFDDAERESTNIIKHASNAYDKARVFNMQASQYILYGMIDKGITYLNDGMRALGKQIKIHPNQFNLMYEILKFKIRYKRIDFVKKICAGPKSFDKNEILYRHMLYTYSFVNLLSNNINDYIFAIMKLSNHYIYDELCNGDLIGVIEIPLSIIEHDYQRVIEWSKLGYEWENAVNNNEYIHIINFNHAYYSLWRYEPWHKTYELYQNTIEQAAMHGDQFIESASAIFDITNRAALGNINEPLEEWPYVLNRIKETNSQSIYMMAEQDNNYFINIGSKEQDDPVLTIDRDFNENVIERYKEQGYDVGIPNHLSYILMLSLIYEAYDRCYSDVNNYIPYEKSLEGNFYDVIINIYLIYCASVVYDVMPEKRKWAKKLMTSAKNKFNAWYQFNPTTLKVFVTVIDAQLAKFNGDISTAISKYDEAYNQSLELNYPQFTALLCEDISRYYRSLSIPRISAYYLSLAQKAYRAWGANRKVFQIYKNYKNFIESHGFTVINPDIDNSTAKSDSTVLPLSNTSQLDIYSLIKSSQAISQEIELPLLIDKMLKNLVENVGAESGSIILLKRDSFYLEGSYDLAQDKSTDLCLSINVSSDRFPSHILNYVITKRSEIVLADSRQDKRFESDQYIKSKKPVSILCSPIIINGKLIGLLYFENNKLANSFTTDRIEILKILSSQVSISIENSRFYAAFQHFVPKEFLSLLGEKNILDVNLGDQINRKMTILTADIRGFTKISEQLSSGDTFSLLNDYLSLMEPIITKHGGFIDKYIGDAIMALFTTNIDDVVKCALEMIETASTFKDERLKKKFKIGISINVGDLILGIVGSSTRFDSTVIGDTVNLASRIESLNSYYKTNLLVSEYVISQLSHENEFIHRVVDCVRVKGKTKPVTLYEILGYKSDINAAEIKSKIDKFDMAWHLYQSKQFNEAKILLENYLAEYPYDYVAHRILSYCHQFIKHGCPDDWDGSVAMSQK